MTEEAVELPSYGTSSARLRSKRSGERDALIPASIMGPRIAFAIAVAALCVLGLVMTYSASSIEALVSEAADPSIFFFRQGLGCLVGVVVCAGIALTDYHRVGPKASLFMLACEFVLLVLVLVPGIGVDENGATRRINLGSANIQPSEFAKPVLLLIGARICVAHYLEGTLSRLAAGMQACIGLGVPLALILGQPDKGTTGVILFTLLVMAYLSGESPKSILKVLGIGALAMFLWSIKDSYSRERILTMIDPFSDPTGNGYQLVQGFYALGSGGFFGLGLGMSRQKYLYLPMSYTDFIFAIIGEELGMVGTLLLLVAFCLILWGGYKIAENANDMLGRLIASGCTTALFVQMLLNVAGVLGMFPLSGKPIPFVSSGVSSVVASLMLAGMVLSVSLHSELPQTVHDELRGRMRIAEQDDEPRAPEPRRRFGDLGRDEAWTQASEGREAAEPAWEPRESSARVTRRPSVQRAYAERPSSERTYEETPDQPRFRVVEGGLSRGPARRQLTQRDDGSYDVDPFARRGRGGAARDEGMGRQRRDTDPTQGQRSWSRNRNRE